MHKLDLSDEEDDPHGQPQQPDSWSAWRINPEGIDMSSQLSAKGKRCISRPSSPSARLKLYTPGLMLFKKKTFEKGPRPPHRVHGRFCFPLGGSLPKWIASFIPTFGVYLANLPLQFSRVYSAEGILECVIPMPWRFSIIADEDSVRTEIAKSR